MYLLHASFVLVLVSVRTADTQNTERCTSGDTAVKNLSCDFNDTCGWQNNPHNNFNWTHKSREMFADGTNAAESHVARLESSEICASLGDRYSFQFGYRLGVYSQTVCQLSVYTTDGTNDLQKWTTRNASDYPLKNVLVILTNVSQSFKIYFEMKKLTNVSGFCEANIDDVVLKHETIATSSVPSVPPTSVTSATPVTSTAPTPPKDVTSTTSATSSMPTILASTESATSTKMTTSAPSQSRTSSQLTGTSTSSQPGTSLTSQSSTPMTSTSVAGHSDGTGENGGSLSTGAIIGIIVALVVCVVVCVAVILVLRRKAAGRKVPHIFKKLRKTQNGNSPPSGGRSVANSADINADDVIAVNTYPAKPNAALSAENQTYGDHVNNSSSGKYHKGPGMIPGNSSSLPHSSGYEVTDASEFSHYYSVLLDEDGTSKPQPGGKTKGGNPDYELATVMASDVGYSSVGDVNPKGNKTATTPTDTYAKVAKIKGDNYNKLSFQNPSFVPLKNTTDDTYNHLQDQDNVYKVPRSDAKEAVMAGKPDKKTVGSPVSADGKSGYVTVSMKGKGKAPLARDDEYNHLNLKDGRPAISAASQGHGQSEDAYNHLNDQSDEYNRVDFEGRALHITGEESGTYSHLADFQV